MANPHTTSSELTNTTTTAHDWYPGQHILRARNGPRTLEVSTVVQPFQNQQYRCKTWKGVTGSRIYLTLPRVIYIHTHKS